MRPFIVVALCGTILSQYPAAGQSSSAQPAPGSAEPKRAVSHPNHNDALFENGPIRPHALADAQRNAAVHKESGGDSAPATTPPPPPPAPTPVLPTVQAVPPGPPQKNLTGDEFGLIRVGSTEKEVLAVLGPPSSQVVVPDDDGHLRETFQYWVKGSPMGTVRLDNSRVVQIETKPK